MKNPKPVDPKHECDLRDSTVLACSMSGHGCVVISQFKQHCCCPCHEGSPRHETGGQNVT